jgi:protein-tyrosine kinase
MSRVYHALEKAEKEKKLKEGKVEPLFEVFETTAPLAVEPVVFRDQPKEAEKIDFPAREEELIPIAPLDTFAAEQFRKLKAHIFGMMPNPPRCILVTSAVPQEGKSLITMNLAVSIAEELNKRVVMIDADLRKPSAFWMKGANGIGLGDYLCTETPLVEIMKGIASKKFIVIPAGNPCKRSAEVIGSKKMKDLLKTLRDQEEEIFILIDSPPILSASEGLLLSQWVDGILWVVRANRASREEITRALRAIDRQKIIGIVFNNREFQPAKNYENYYQHYSSAKR